MIEWFWGLFGWKRKVLMYQMVTGGSAMDRDACRAALRAHAWKDLDGYWHLPEVVPARWHWVKNAGSSSGS